MAERAAGAPAHSGPLFGIRVLDLSRVVSGPFAGRMMSDLGADVVKLEPPDGDMTRVWGEVRHGLSGFYTQQNAGKRNVCIDLRQPEGVELARRLAGVADVLIENFRPGVMARLGLGWEVLAADNPGLIMLSVTGFGPEGSDASRAAFAPVIHAESGLIGRQAAFDQRAPSDPMLSIADTNAALHGLVGVLSCLLERQRTHRGQHVEISMLESMLATDDYAHHALDGFPMRRLGGEIWDGPGGPLLISGEFRYVWRQLNRVLGVADPAPDAPLEDKILARRQAAAQWIASRPDRRSLLADLERADLAWADVREPMASFDSPTARGAWTTVDDRGGGQRRVVQSPYHLSSSPTGARGGAPYRGEHNTAVLSEWLGLDAEEVAALVGSGCLLAEPVGPP
ncbi:MAG TPA: CoA transferase [Acidimicrobiales bacterium]|nr:CoA transferase [Acidimicrobiales bacterium]